MKHFTKSQKAIIDSYLAAKLTGKWDNSFDVKTPADLRKALAEGKTLKQVMDEIEIRYVSIPSLLMASEEMFCHLSGAYKAGIRKGFRRLFTNLNIE